MHIDILFLSCLMRKKKEDPQLCVYACARACSVERQRGKERETEGARKLFFCLIWKKEDIDRIDLLCFVCLRTTVMAHWCVDRKNLFFFRLITDIYRQKYWNEEKTTFFVLDKDRYSASLIDWPNQVIIEPNERYMDGVGVARGRKQKRKSRKPSGVFFSSFVK